MTFLREWLQRELWPALLVSPARSHATALTLAYHARPKPSQKHTQPSRKSSKEPAVENQTLHPQAQNMNPLQS
jgi:hypothetical protein